jgi:hypothetical protein
VPLNKAQVVGKAAMSYSVENSKIKGCNLMVFFLFTAFIGCRKESLQSGEWGYMEYYRPVGGDKRKACREMKILIGSVVMVIF